MKKPIIGVSGSWITDQGGMFPGYHRSYVNDDYISSVTMAGGVPYIVPFNEDPEVTKAQVEQLDGLILSGGHDVSPEFYNQEPQQQLGEIWPERDKFDFALIAAAEEKGIPILGICRGAQILAVYHGGNLYQDLSLYPKEVLKHEQGHTPTLKSHSVMIQDGSIFQKIFQTNEMMVNSFHHQLIGTLPEFLQAEVHAKDSVIEGFVNTKYPNLEIAIQWHPEMLHRVDPKMMRLFEYFIKQAKGV